VSLGVCLEKVCILFTILFFDSCCKIIVIKYNMILFIYLLTAIGLPLGGSSTHKQYVEQHNSLIRKSVDRAPFLQGIPWHLPYN